MKQPKCKICKKPFQRFRSTQTVCGYDCAKTEGERKQAEKKKQQRKSDKATREALESVSSVKAKLQPKINELARLIDYGLPCIATGNGGKMSGGHLHHAGGSDSIRFNLHNIHRQSYQSNSEKAGDIINYLAGLENEYGKEYRDFIEYDLRQTPVQNWTKEQLRQAMKDCNKIKKELIKLIEYYGQVSPEIRVQRRSLFNNLLGLYQGFSYNFDKKV
jgi:hypothetical protein